MLELFRKYSMLAFVVLILLFLGLIFMVDGVGQSGMGTGPKMMTYKGKAYTQSEVERQGADYANMFQSVMMGGYTQAFADVMPYAQTVMAADKVQYLGNRLLLKELSAQYGATPNQEQIEGFIKTKLFTDKNGEFDQASYAIFIEKRVQRYGLGVQDFNTLVGEMISLNTLQKIVGSGFALDEKVSEMQEKIARQELTYEQFTLTAETVQKSLTVTDEEVKAYWEKNQKDYMADPKKKIQYVISDAQLADKIAKGKAAALEAAKKEGKTEEELKEFAYTLPTKEKTQYLNEAGDKIDQLFVNTQDAAGKGFKELAEKLSFEVQSTDLFTKAEIPATLQALVAQKQEVTETIFSLPAAQGMASLSDVVSLGNGKFMLFQVVEEKQAEPLPYEEVTSLAKADFLNSQAGELLEEKMNELKAELAKNASSDNLADVAAKLELTYHKRSKVTKSQPLDQEPSAVALFDKAAETADKAFSDVIVQNTPEEGVQRAVVVRPLARVYTETEANKAGVTSQAKRTNATLETVIFSNWFKHNLAQSEFVKL